MVKINTLNHGRETYVVYYGGGFVLKRPLPNFNDAQKDAWLEKQHKTQATIDAIRAINHTVYNIPKMEFINDEEYQILEQRAPGEKLTRDLFFKLSSRQRNEIINSLGTFLVDMNELRNLPYRDYKITFEDKNEYANLDLNGINVLKKDDFEKSILIRVNLKDTNDIIKRLARKKIKAVSEKKHTLEEYFVKDIGGQSDE